MSTCCLCHNIKYFAALKHFACCCVLSTFAKHLIWPKPSMFSLLLSYSGNNWCIWCQRRHRGAWITCKYSQTVVSDSCLLFGFLPTYIFLSSCLKTTYCKEKSNQLQCYLNFCNKCVLLLNKCKVHIKFKQHQMTFYLLTAKAETVKVKSHKQLRKCIQSI